MRRSTTCKLASRSTAQGALATRSSCSEVPVPVRDPKVFRALYREHTGLLTATAARQGVPVGEREELVQTAFLRLLETTAIFLSLAAVRGFLVTTLKNLVIDRSRRSHVRLTQAVGFDVDRLDSPANQGSENHERAVIAAGEMIDRIAATSGNAAFALYYRDGLSAKDIAARTGEAIGSVTAKLCRLRARHAESIRTHVETAAALL